MGPREPTPEPPDRPRYDPLTGAYRVHHDWAGPTALTSTVCLAVAAVTGRELSATSPLSDAVDPDALDQLFDPGQAADEPTDHVMVTYGDCEVTVYRDGHVVIQPPDSA